MSMTPSFPPESIEKALAAAEEAGVPRGDLLGAAGLAPGAPLSFRQLCAVYEHAARLTGDSDFGLHVGERTSPRMYGLLGYVAANSASFGEALARLVEFQPLWSDAAGLDLIRERAGARLLYWHKGGIPAEERRQEGEQMLAALVVFARSVLAAPVRPAEVRFEHRAPRDAAEHKRVFDCPITFGANRTEIAFPDGLLDRPAANADPILGKLMKEQADAALARRRVQEPFIERLDDAVRAAIVESGGMTLGALAKRLGLGPRTLQRRLRERDLTFRIVLEGARIDLAKQLLESSGLALGQIAFRLGFSQPSAFHRAFSRATGATPQAYRRVVRAAEERR